MAKGRKAAVNGVSPTARQKTNRFNLRIVMLELKQIFPMVNVGVDMDEETRKEVERTLFNCAERLSSIARHYERSKAEKSSAVEGVAHG